MEASDASFRKAEQRFYVYVLLSLKDNRFYVGFSPNLKKRIGKHFAGKVIATKHRLPLKLIHYEYFINKTDALARERFFKSGFGRKQLKEALKRTLKNTLKQIQASPSETNT